MTRVPVAAEMLRWACERSGRGMADLAARVPQLPAWVRGERQPTLKQLEKLATATRTPFGYLFLAAPPEERLRFPTFAPCGVLPGRDRAPTCWTRCTACNVARSGSGSA